MSIPMTAIKGFVAGFLSVLTVMTAAWWATRAAGFIPANAPPFWAMEPTVAPFGVPLYLNRAFWGGVWGLGLNFLLRGLSGATYWLAWILAGGLFYTLGTLFLLRDDRVPFFHATWHLFVIAGSACHYFAVWGFVVAGA